MTAAPAFPLAFGCMQFGTRADAAASEAMFDACLAAGVTHFDTAHVYGDGASETLLGRLAARLGDRVQVATKIAYTGGAGAANLQAQFDLSRRRLGGVPVDLLYLHRHDPDTPMDHTLGLLADWQRQGLIRRIGLSNHAAWQVMKAQAAAARLGTRIDAIQPMYSLVKRQAEVELLPMARDQGLATYGYSPLGGGLLTGKYAVGGAGRLTEDARYAARYADPALRGVATGLANLAAELGTHPVTLAVAWVCAHPAHPVPLVSGRNAAQLAPALAAARFPVPPALYARLSALSPAPPPATDRSEEG